jgi:hypothetical protein
MLDLNSSDSHEQMSICIPILRYKMKPTYFKGSSVLYTLTIYPSIYLSIYLLSIYLSFLASLQLGIQITTPI